ncbi:hypothetical protein CLOM_g10148 [Closterium sp. NIES-68]|nr:hypothetical protein CLOM_g10148 [Closterium sp. NIES-68]GJP71676.1 hypothetical protein CLOP_g2487 [Closterium sp. NIES-67]
MSLVIAISLLCVVAAASPAVTAQMPNTPGGQIGGEAGIERAMSLFRAWEEAYGLKPDIDLPPEKVTLPLSVPPAPHLEDCAALTAVRKASEQRGANGESPMWARPANCCGCNPQPPWLRGSDADNLPLTRVVQRDLWEYQLFHGSCEGRRLLVVPWSTGKLHGVGSQVHVTSAFLSLAMIHNRTLVPQPGSYDRAFTQACNATNTSGSWDCFFFPIVNPDCERIAAEMAANGTLPTCSTDDKGHDRVAASADPVVCLNSNVDKQMGYESRAATLWGKAYAASPDVVEFMGQLPRTDDKYQMLHWWRSQSVRFMLRWPSAHMCHATNKERHTAYGLHTASHLARYSETQVEIVRAVVGDSAVNISESDEAKRLLGITFAPPGNIETQVWGIKGYAGCNETCMGAADAKALRDTYVAVGGEPFVVRPIVSVHVRQSDKGIEMRLSSFASHMFFAHRLRRYAPDLRYVWLNTEMESVIQESTTYPDWKFLYSSNSRQPIDAKSNREYEFSQSVAASFASAIIASQCDYFVGALGSNWSRLINELRATNGRLLNGFIAINMGDW